jgi:hypothetical protein
MLILSIAPVLTFGENFLRDTNGAMGTAELILATAVGDISFVDCASFYYLVNNIADSWRNWSVAERTMLAHRGRNWVSGAWAVKKLAFWLFPFSYSFHCSM